MLALGLVSVAGHVEIVAWLALACLLTPLIPGSSTASAAVLSGPAIAGAVCTWLAVASWLGLHSHTTVLLVSWLAAATYLVLRRQRPLRPRWRSFDLAGLAAGIATFLILLRPFLQASPGRRLALLSRTADSATHLQMVRAVARAGGYLMRVPDSELGGTRGVGQYPPGFSGILGTVVQPDERASLTALVVPTVIVACAIAALITWVTTLLVATALAHKGPGWHEPVAAGCAAVLLTVFGPTALLLADGAFAQILALLGVLAALLLVSRPGNRPVPATACLCVFTVLTMHAWYLLAPALIAPWLVHLRAVRRPLRTLAVIGVPLIPVCLYPVLHGPGRSQLEVAGFIDIPGGPATVAFLGCTVGALFALVLPPGARPSHLPLLGALVALLLAAAALGMVQIASTGALSYYFFKLMTGTAVVAVPVLIASAVTLSTPRSPRQVLPALVLASLMGLMALDTALRQAVSNTVPPQLVGGLQRQSTGGPALSARQIVEYLGRVASQHVDGHSASHDIWFIGCSRSQMYVLDKWPYDLSLGWTPARRWLINSLRFPSRDLDSDLLARVASPDVTSVDIYYAKACPPGRLKELEADAKVTLVQLA